MAQRAEQELPLLERCEITVTFADGEYRISGGGEADEIELSLAVTFSALFTRMHEHALRHYADHIRIHAASGFAPDGLVLLVGEKEAGKTTTAMHLLLEGFEMVGDELVLLRHGEAITFPRPFYLRHGALALLPPFGDTSTAPFVNSDVGGKLIAVDPQKLGRRWRIRPAPVRAMVFLEPNHGGTTSFKACSKVEMVQRVLTQASPPSSGRADWVSDFCSTINQAETVIARMGDLHSATALFRRLMT
ncbi:MAG: hypothetical protein P4M07_09280 [Xanthobacteraceae bacterium]|nr:hypothetical protein [Xanthobacteraceae bacterium]